MKHTKIILSFILVLTVFLAACSTEDGVAVQDGPYIGGTLGVTGSFEPLGVEEDGTFTIFDTETFPLEVTVINKGEYDIQPGDITVELLGPSQSEFSGIASYTLQNSDELDAISDLVPDGGEETISFGDDVKYEEDVNNFVERDWFANIEFYYETELLIPEVCLKEDLTDERICDVNEAKTFFVSGAPVTVKSVVEDTAGKGIMALKIAIEKAGTGDLAKPNEDFGIRDEIAYVIDDDAWECKSSGKVNEARLNDGTAEIVCKLKTALAEDHLSTKQIKLTLQYKYRDIVQETLRIKESAE